MFVSRPDVVNNQVWTNSRWPIKAGIQAPNTRLPAGRSSEDEAKAAGMIKFYFLRMMFVAF
jgi:hypothetical protein